MFLFHIFFLFNIISFTLVILELLKVKPIRASLSCQAFLVMSNNLDCYECLFVEHSLEEDVEGGVRAFHKVLEAVVPTFSYIRGPAYDREDSFILIPFGWSVTSRSSCCANPDLFKVLKELSKVRRESRFDNVVSLYNFSLRYPRKGTKHLDC